MKTSDIFVENLVNEKLLLAAFYHLTYQHDSKDFNICNNKKKYLLTIVVHGRQDALEGGLALAVKRVAEVVAGAVDGAVLGAGVAAGGDGAVVGEDAVAHFQLPQPVAALRATQVQAGKEMQWIEKRSFSKTILKVLN